MRVATAGLERFEMVSISVKTPRLGCGDRELERVAGGSERRRIGGGDRAREVHEHDLAGGEGRVTAVSVTD
jgi:hypothetical protein